MNSSIDLLVVGAGAAGLSAALRFKELAPEKTVVVIDKAPRPGAGNFSGAVLDPNCLEELVPNWEEQDDPYLQELKQKLIRKDRLSLLLPKGRLPIAHWMIPSNMSHLGDYLISLGSFCSWLSQRCEAAGVELLYGFPADKLLVEEGRVCGVKLKDAGRDSEGNPQPHFKEGEAIKSGMTIIADGSLGVLSRQLVEEFHLQNPLNPQVYSIGLKQIVLLDKPRLKAGSVHYFLGYPNRNTQFGGGFLYSLSEDKAALGLIIGLDFPYADLNPQQELELLKAHPFIARTLRGSQVIATGAKTIPEGGYFSMPTSAAPGALLVGDSGGFVDVSRFKGIHLAIRSGIAAAVSSLELLSRGGSENRVYRKELKRSGILQELFRARNFRQAFAPPRTLFPAAIMSLYQHRLKKRYPLAPDREGGSGFRPRKRKGTPFGRDRFTALSGTTHREDQPSHIRIRNPELCARCLGEKGAPCLFFCPGQVYEKGSNGKIELSPSNCLHDCSCVARCPFNNIEWNVPEGGEGPDYMDM